MEISTKYKRCDNCFFSVWAMSPNRPALICKQKGDLPGRWQIVLLEESCWSFYPSSTCNAGSNRKAGSKCKAGSKTGSEVVRRIALTQGKFAFVDAKDYYRLAQFQWFASFSGNTFYAVRKYGGKPVKMHRWIMNAPDGLVVDHIDHNGLNNCRSNLRLCSHVQNTRNAVCNNGASSKYKGVCRRRKTKKWRAAIKFNKKSYNLGDFTDEIAAAKAYDKKAAEFFGEFACLNFPPPPPKGQAKGQAPRARAKV